MYVRSADVSSTRRGMHSQPQPLQQQQQQQWRFRICFSAERRGRDKLMHNSFAWRRHWQLCSGQKLAGAQLFRARMVGPKDGITGLLDAVLNCAVTAAWWSAAAVSCNVTCQILLLSDTATSPSVCPSPRRAATLCYRHAGCLQLRHVRTAEPSADGRRSAESRNAIGGGISYRSSRGDNLLLLGEWVEECVCVCWPIWSTCLSCSALSCGLLNLV